MSSAPVRTIEREELREKIARGLPFKLVNSLSDWEFRAMRIPGSLHFATNDELTAALQQDEDVVVYCSNPACPASLNAYYHLVNHGFTNVRRYAGGIQDWQQAGLPLEGERARG